MVDWEPISEVELLDVINSACRRMNPAQHRLWEAIKIDPQKWSQHPWGDVGGGFWVAAIVGKECLFYNDIEDGWNWSVYEAYGEIRDYWCNQDELELAVQHIIDGIGAEGFSVPRRGPPMPVEWKDC